MGLKMYYNDIFPNPSLKEADPSPADPSTTVVKYSAQSISTCRRVHMSPCHRVGGPRVKGGSGLSPGSKSTPLTGMALAVGPPAETARATVRLTGKGAIPRRVPILSASLARKLTSVAAA